MCYCARFALLYFAFEGNFKLLYKLPGSYIRRGDVMVLFLALRVWGAYTWRGLFSEFTVKENHDLHGKLVFYRVLAALKTILLMLFFLLIAGHPPEWSRLLVMIVLARKYASSASILSKEKIIKLKYDSLWYGFCLHRYTTAVKLGYNIVKIFKNFFFCNVL